MARGRGGSNTKRRMTRREARRARNEQKTQEAYKARQAPHLPAVPPMRGSIAHYRHGHARACDLAVCTLPRVRASRLLRPGGRSSLFSCADAGRCGERVSVRKGMRLARVREGFRLTPAVAMRTQEGRQGASTPAARGQRPPSFRYSNCAPEGVVFLRGRTCYPLKKRRTTAAMSAASTAAATSRRKRMGVSPFRRARPAVWYPKTSVLSTRPFPLDILLIPCISDLPNQTRRCLPPAVCSQGAALQIEKYKATCYNRQTLAV